jgi:hypothetical protein
MKVTAQRKEAKDAEKFYLRVLRASAYSAF